MRPQAGAPVPPLERHIGLPDMIAYAGATWDWHRLHYDQAYLAERGLPAPVVDGQVFGALLAETVQDWLGGGWRIAALSFRLSEMVFAGETVRCEGSVAHVEDGRVTVELSVVALDITGAPVKTAVAGARAELVRRA